MQNFFGRDGDGKDSSGLNVNFFNKDKAKVGGEFGVVNGDVHIYDVPPGASPEERFAAALNFLDGNVQSRAEKLISEAVDGGYRNNKVGYYWALSVLSGRSFDHLRPEDFDTIQGCLTLVDQEIKDDWIPALWVIVQFINCLIEQDRGTIDDENLELVIQDYDRLQKDRREEIRRHLDLIMTGALQDRLDTKYAAEITQNRMAGDRKIRGWKFFAPIPEPPRLETFAEPLLSQAQRAAAITGAVTGAAALLLILIAAVAHQPLLGLVLVVGAGGGGYLIATAGRPWLATREQNAAAEARRGEINRGVSLPAGRAAAGGTRPGETPVHSRYRVDPTSEQSADDADFERGLSDKADEEHDRNQARRRLFESFVQPWIDVCFAFENPDGAKNRDRWWKDTERLRRALASDLVRRYAGPDIAINQLDWLITWHAKQAKKRWQNGSLDADRTLTRREAGKPNGGLTFLGVLGVLIGLGCGLAGAFADLRYGAILLLALGVSGWIVYGSGIDAYVIRRDVHRAESALAAKQHAPEQAEFDRWRKVLQDRPTDAEMGRWLDYDKLYVKDQILKNRSFTNRDIVTHAILTEAQYPALKARVLFGPPRYSHYWVTVILLTERGVRKISMGLNFLDGTVSPSESRKVFPYDSISSADLVKVQVRSKGDQRTVIAVDEGAEGGRPADVGAGNGAMPGAGDRAMPGTHNTGQADASVVLGEALRVSLNSGGYVDFAVSNFDEAFLDRRREKAEDVYLLTRETSGMAGAFQVLEAVSAEGSGWIGVERERRNRKIMDIQRAMGQRPAELSESGRRSRRELSGRPGVMQVAVPGGNIIVECVNVASAPVLAVHGISSQRRQWNWLRAARTDLSLIMPDLRGRGDSAGVSGHSSVARHAEDMVAVLDRLGLDAVHVCGVSLGGFVAVELATAYPDRVKSLVLVDGGLPTALPSGLTPEATPTVVRERLLNRDLLWPSMRDYAGFFTAEVAPLLDPADPLLLDYLMHELDGPRARLDCAMLAADAASIISSPFKASQVRVPVRLVTAEWGVGADSPPAYPDEHVRAMREELAIPVTVSSVAGVDHTACIMSPAGARAVAGEIDRALS